MNHTAHPLPLSGGDEQDALTGWHHYLVCLGRPRVRRRTKTRYNRRVRRAGRMEARNGRHEEN